MRVYGYTVLVPSQSPACPNREAGLVAAIGDTGFPTPFIAYVSLFRPGRRCDRRRLRTLSPKTLVAGMYNGS